MTDAWRGRLSASEARAIAERHGLRGECMLAAPWSGATSCVYPYGDVVIKVPHGDEPSIAAVRTDATVSPVARGLGVRTPRLVAFGETGEVLAVPYAVYDRVHGEPVPTGLADPSVTAGVWRAVGRDLALVHATAVADDALRGLRVFAQSPDVDPRPWVADLAETGLLDAAQAAWLAGLLDRLAPAALAGERQTLCHGDVNAANVLAASRSGVHGFLALIDWAGAGWLDPAWDFAAVPLRVVPVMLEGHRSAAPLAGDETAEARILWCHLQFALHRLRREPSAATDAERARRLLDAARAFARTTGIA